MKPPPRYGWMLMILAAVVAVGLLWAGLGALGLVGG